MMRKISIFLFLLGSILYWGCSKVDTTPPVINIFGNNPDTLILNQNFIEPGFSAQDDKDGDITNHVGISGLPPLNKDIAGSYLRYYSVNDAAGNKDTVVRTVVVYNQASLLSGNYSGVSNCQFTGGPLNFSSRISSSNYVNYNIFFTNFGGSFGVNVIDSASFNPTNNTLTFNCPQSLGGTNTLISASGFVSGSFPHYTITVNYTWSDGGGNHDNCTATYSN